MAEKKKSPTFTTPKGVAVYPHLVNADFRFDKERGSFHVKLKLPADAEIKVDGEMRDMGEYLEELRQGAIKQAKADNPKAAKAKKGIKEADLPIQEDVDEETGDETGYVVYNFKMPHKIKKKDSDEILKLEPRLFDANGTAIKPGSIYGGTTMKIAFQVWPFYTALVGAGISLKLRACQIIELVEGGNAESYGFDTDDSDVETGDAEVGSDDDGKEEDF